jgi:hypothetical protein
MYPTIPSNRMIRVPRYRVRLERWIWLTLGAALALTFSHIVLPWLSHL